MEAKKAADQLTREVMTRLKATRPAQVDCPRAKSFMTPCIARDGRTALADDNVCVGCGEEPNSLLREAVKRSQE